MPSIQPDSQNNGLADAINVVRQRVVADRWLAVWVLCCNWLLAASLVAVAFLRSVRMPLVILLALALALALGAALFLWFRRPSSYALMQRLDAEGHLGDRLSTAVYFWQAPSPSEIIVRQREDALAHLARIQPRDLFPIHAPSKMWRTWALLAGLALVCAYHARFGPPIPALKARATQSRAVATVFSPFARALQMAHAGQKELGSLIEQRDAEHESATAQKQAELPPSAEPTATTQVAGNVPNSQVTPPAGQPTEGSESSPGQTANPPNGNATQTPNANGQAPSPEEHSAQNSGSGQNSVAQRALQALQNLLDSTLGKDGGAPQQSQSAPSLNNSGATGTPMMPGASQTPVTAAAQAAQGQTANSQNANTAANKSSGKHTGAGNGTHPWEDGEAHDPQLAANAAQEHVMLQANGFRGPPGKERADVEAGTAQIPMQNIAPQAVATVNGSGQDSVPPRYRQYVQNYFQRSGK